MMEMNLVSELEGLRSELVASEGAVKFSGHARIGPVNLDRELVRRLANALHEAVQELDSSKNARSITPVRDGLSKRQREILSWVALGKSNSVIASILDISPHTVDTHLRRIFDRLGTTDRTVAAIRGIEEGFIQPPLAQVA